MLLLDEKCRESWICNSSLSTATAYIAYRHSGHQAVSWTAAYSIFAYTTAVALNNTLPMPIILYTHRVSSTLSSRPLSTPSIPPGQPLIPSISHLHLHTGRPLRRLSGLQYHTTLVNCTACLVNRPYNVPQDPRSPDPEHTFANVSHRRWLHKSQAPAVPASLGAVRMGIVMSAPVSQPLAMKPPDRPMETDSRWGS